jgi:hypothetical protein
MNICNKRAIKKLNWAWFTFNKKLFYLKYGNVMVKMVEQLISKFKVVGSTPTTLFEIFLFFSFTYL